MTPTTLATLNTDAIPFNDEKIIVHVVQHLRPGGIESLVLDLLHYAASNQRVFVISIEGERQQAISDWPRLTPYAEQLIFLTKPKGISYQTLKDLHHQLVSLNADVVHTHHLGPLLYGGLAAKLANTSRCIHTEHDVWHLDNLKHRWLERWALSIVKPTLVGDANRVTRQLHTLFNYPNIKTILNGIDCNKFKPADKALARHQYHLPISSTVIGCAGRLEWVKGHDQLIRAMAELPEHIELAIAGKGSQEGSLHQLAKTLNVTHRIHFVGLVTDMPNFYNSLDLFCLPSRSEGFPLAPLEAQACGIPVVAMDVGATSETICTTTGRVIESGNITDLTHAIICNLAQENDGQTSRNFVLKNGNLSTMLDAYQALIKDSHPC
jgi:glycosyltransferase involved in cell wall biosynthesis